MKIIYISGIDGCGKTTQAKVLVQDLERKGVKTEYIWLRWEPSLLPVINFFKDIQIKHSAKLSENYIQNENIKENLWLGRKKCY